MIYRGVFLDPAMRTERVSREKILAAMRSAGAATPSQVDAVVIEADGSFGVVSGAA